MSTLSSRYLKPEEYLEIERKAEFKSEYFNGEMFAMSGCSRRHDRIAVQLTLLLAQHLRGSTCEPFTANMRVLATPSGLYTYPDLSVACDEPQFADGHVDTLTNPTLLIEILSPSTEDYDRGKKAKLYRAIPSLQELLFIAQDSYEVELFRREADGSWRLLEAKGQDSKITLTSIGYTLTLRELYEKVSMVGQDAEAVG
jgi:Uma2 family endonuclease